MGTLHEDLHAFMIISCWILRTRNVSDKSAKKIKPHILCSVTFFQKLCCLWENVEKHGRARQATDDNTIQCMCFASWITKAINTHSERVILIAFAQQRWSHEHTWMLRVYIHCLSCSSVCNSWVTGGGIILPYIPWLWSRFGAVPCLLFVFIDLFVFRMCSCISDVAMCGARVQNWRCSSLFLLCSCAPGGLLWVNQTVHFAQFSSYYISAKYVTLSLH